MTTSDFHTRRRLGKTDLEVSRIGLSGGYKAPAVAAERAFHEYGVNFFYWEGRKAGMRNALRGLLPGRRDELVIAIQSYDHSGFFVERSAERALRALGTDHADIFFLGWVNRTPRARMLEAARRLKEAGKVRYIGITGHNRRFHGELASDPGSPIDVHMVRYNAAHRGAEQEVFAAPQDAEAAAARPGMVTYTATRWGKLVSAKHAPPGERPLTAAECYRFVLSHPGVDACLAGPRTVEEMEQGLQALDLGPMSEEELAFARRVGDHVHG